MSNTPGRVKTGRQGSCFVSEKHLGVCGIKNTYAGINEQLRVFASSYHPTWENLPSLSITGLQVAISQSP